MNDTRRLFHWIFALVALGTSGGPVFAADLNPTGAWQVIGYTAQDAQSGTITEPFGPQPTGTAIYTAKGHMSVLVTGRNRAAATSGSDAERGAAKGQLLDSMYGYAGSYTMNGKTVTIHIESAWQPAWVGTDRVRTLTLDGDTLTITTPPMQSPVDAKTYISVTRFKRVE